MSQLLSEKSLKEDYLFRFKKVRQLFLSLVETLEIEDFVVQPVQDVSPPKWHLAHTTWFFEVFVLVPYLEGYKLFHPDYPYLFNSYYVAAGDRWTRAARGHLTRPTVKEIMQYRAYVEKHMTYLMEHTEPDSKLAAVIEIGLQHEQQHQELFLYDIKYILGHNPLFPAYRKAEKQTSLTRARNWLQIAKGNYEIGYDGNEFSFDNEHGRHEVHLERFEIADQLVTNGEYLEFIQEGGYRNPALWLSEGWDWVSENEIGAPMYWFHEDNFWTNYTLSGLEQLDRDAPVSHISFYEADAYARWKGFRLPTEFEWEIAARQFGEVSDINHNFLEQQSFQPISSDTPAFFGNLWEWTSSSYLPYPFYQAPEGALGEYNGKFMVNQKVLRGGSYGTSRDHIRLTYRNFFHPHLQWLFGGIRLARHI